MASNERYDSRDRNGARRSRTVPSATGAGVLTAIVLVCLVPQGLRAGGAHCTKVKPTSGATGEAVSLHVPLRFPDGAVDGALEIWEQCRALGHGLPEIRVGEMASVNLVVRYSRESAGNARCGMIQGRLITLYAYARDARGRALHCGPPAVNLAHELGHFFGLADAERDTSCESHLMSGVSTRYGGMRSVNEEVCSAVASLWMQAGETGEAGE